MSAGGAGGPGGKPGGGKRRPDLGQVSTSTLERLGEALAEGRIKQVTATALTAAGIRHHAETIATALSGYPQSFCEHVVAVVLAERARNERPAPELVWTGPEGPAGTARDTAVVLRALFESAQEQVLLAGYSFDHARDVLAPLHQAMLTRGVTAIFVVDVEQAQVRRTPLEAHADEQLADFVKQNWPFGPPYPRLFYDRRALQPGPPWCSMHAKCVVIDGHKAFVSSANFTQRGQERNIEAGVLLHDPHFAEHLARQWLSLIDDEHVLAWEIPLGAQTGHGKDS